MSSRAPNRMLDEFARMMTDAAGAAQGVRREMETVFRAQGERLLNQMDLVQREEFEAVREMAMKARTENEALKERMAELEKRSATTRADRPALLHRLSTAAGVRAPRSGRKALRQSRLAVPQAGYPPSACEVMNKGLSPLSRGLPVCMLIFMGDSAR